MISDSENRRCVLISAMACSPAFGSEGWIAYRYVERLAQHFTLTVIAAKPAMVPDGVTLYELDIGKFDPNDTGNAAHRLFERKQQKLLSSRPNLVQEADVVHRLTPCTLSMPTRLANCGKPLVIGPAIEAEGAPGSFDRYRHWELSRGGIIARTLSWLERQKVKWKRNRLDHVHRSALVIAGNAIAEREVGQVSGSAADFGASKQSNCRFLRVPHVGIEHKQFLPSPARWVNQDDEGPLRLLFVGRAVAYKGVELLLESLASLGSTVDFRLTLAGDFATPYGDICRAQVESFNLSERVTWLARVPRDELVDVYRRHHVFCFPTLSDTYGIAMLEAMSCGCAVIASDICGPAELINNDRGIKVPMIDPEQYVRDTASAITSLAHDRCRLQSLGRAARDYVIATHDWNRILDAVLDAYPIDHVQKSASLSAGCRESLRDKNATGS